MDLTLQKDGVEISIPPYPWIENGQLSVKAIEEYARLLRELEAFRGFAADKLLALYNDNWVDDEIGKMDHASFMARLSKPSIHLGDESGAATVYFEDGGLFAGHWIEVLVERGVATHAGIIG